MIVLLGVWLKVVILRLGLELVMISLTFPTSLGYILFFFLEIFVCCVLFSIAISVLNYLAG